MINWQLRLGNALNGLPSIKLSLHAVRYNPNRDLKEALRTFDLPRLSQLFRDGLARPTDYVILRKPVSLLEVILQSMART